MAAAKASAGLPDSYEPIRIQDAMWEATKAVTIEVEGHRRDIKVGDRLGIADPLPKLLPESFTKILVDR
jgi:hypothetical protein